MLDFSKNYNISIFVNIFNYQLLTLNNYQCLYHLENDLSVIANPKLHSKGRFLHYGAWLGTERQSSYKERLRLAINDALTKRPADFDAFLRLMEASGFTVKYGRGGVISFLVPGQERATRLRASTLGDGYDPEDIKAVIAGERPIPEQPVPVPAAPRRVNLIVDIQERLRSGKGAAYARWAKVYNLKQMAAALQFMHEQNITEYDQLSAKTEDAVSRFHALTEQLRRTEADLSVTSELMDCLVPGIGEIIGGSQREDNYDTLVQRMQECGLKEKDYQFYLDLRKYGSTRHAGFGLGFERCVMYLTGISNIRDVLPFPRTVGNCEL